jgi:hypothetical protein
MYKLAKIVSHEITMKYQLQSAGANSAKVLEKFEKNSKYVRNMSIFMKVMISFYFATMAFIPTLTYSSIMESISVGNVPYSALILTSSSTANRSICSSLLDHRLSPSLHTNSSPTQVVLSSAIR